MTKVHEPGRKIFDNENAQRRWSKGFFQELEWYCIYSVGLELRFLKRLEPVLPCFNASRLTVTGPNGTDSPRVSSIYALLAALRIS